MVPKRALSASSIKCLDTCTWMYWVQFHQKVPQKGNAGSLRGTIVHLVFELLLNPRHRKHYNVIMTARTINASPAIRRLVIRNLIKSGILNVENYEMCDDMIVVGLGTDFFGKGGILGQPEFRFELESQDPEYKIRGYIDKHITYPDGTVKIVDYKSSKSKLSGDDLEANIQSFAYCLVGYKLLGAKDVSADFIFLRFPRSPIQSVHPTKEQLEGFEQYLAYVYQLINNFDEKQARSNMAAYSKKNRWLCKAGSWECPYMRRFSYYALKNPDGTIARTSLKKEELTATEGQIMEELQYDGCPAFSRSYSSNEL